eukprot:2473326-Rhodomonas_salina.1
MSHISLSRSSLVSRPRVACSREEQATACLRLSCSRSSAGRIPSPQPCSFPPSCLVLLRAAFCTASLLVYSFLVRGGVTWQGGGEAVGGEPDAPFGCAEAGQTAGTTRSTAERKQYKKEDHEGGAVVGENAYGASVLMCGTELAYAGGVGADGGARAAGVPSYAHPMRCPALGCALNVARTLRLISIYARS